MRPDQASLWYRRVAAIYALGAWSLLGSVFLFGHKSSTPSGGEGEQKNISTKEVLDPPKGFYMETVVTYKEDIVPITDKILNYLKSWTGGPGSES